MTDTGIYFTPGKNRAGRFRFGAVLASPLGASSSPEAERVLSKRRGCSCLSAAHAGGGECLERLHWLLQELRVNARSATLSGEPGVAPAPGPPHLCLRLFTWTLTSTPTRPAQRWPALGAAASFSPSTAGTRESTLSRPGSPPSVCSRPAPWGGASTRPRPFLRGA